MGYNYKSGFLKNIMKRFSSSPKKESAKESSKDGDEEPKPEPLQAPHKRSAPKASAQGNQNMKLLGGLAIVLVIVLFFSFSMTGFVTYQGSLEDELNETKTNLSLASDQLVACSSNLLEKDSDYQSCLSGLDSTKSFLESCQDTVQTRDDSISSLNSDIASCNSEKENLGNEISTVKSSYNELVKNTVRDLCCTFSDANSGAEKSWGISSNSIVCTGPYTVNCGSGSTSFP